MNPAKLGIVTEGGSRSRTRLFYFNWDKMTDTAQLLRMAEPIVRRFDCDIVQLMFVREKPGWVLRLLIEKSGSDPFVGSGIDHSICSGISRELGELLEGDEVIDKHFVLEVSSPGIERPLTTLDDYRRFVKRRVKVKTNTPVNGKKKFTGLIDGVDGEVVRLKTDHGKTLVDVDIAFEKIAKANLIFDSKMLEKKLGER
ncbi:MAG: ribosome maturation factor RimP [Deltaproteobacteria bacterium]|nr:ribosome maturation factor RimP [Deltaproteobacteria bacterium]MBN2671397.1 ribosome maturation factor RimP [Deltaproteobacteria bacterium]